MGVERCDCIGTTGFIPLADLGMTREKYALLKELAGTSDHWAIAYVQVEAAANLKLISLSYYLRGRLTSIILELDNELCMKSWGLDKIEFKAVEKPQWQEARLESSFDRMRKTLMKEVK